MHRLRDLVTLISGATLLLLILGGFSASAASASISRSYNAEGDIQGGSLVSLVQGRTGYVEAANPNNAQRLLGVAVAKNQSLLEVDPLSGSIQVATDGTATALVSTVDGSINVGDKVAVSPFNGVGMKASSGSWTIGLAQTSFSSTTTGATKEEVKDTSGKSHQIYIGYIRIGIAIGSNSGLSAPTSGLQKLGQAITGHPLSNTRIIISLVVAVVAVVAIITLIYASIYGSIISIGRNPLAKYVVIRTLTSVLGMVVLIGAVASLTIFLLLH